MNAGFQREQAKSEEKEKVKVDSEEEKEGEEGELGSSQDPESTPAPSPSLPKALHRQFFWRWWLAGLLTLISRKCTSPIAQCSCMTRPRCLPLFRNTYNNHASIKPSSLDMARGFLCLRTPLHWGASRSSSHGFHETSWNRVRNRSSFCAVCYAGGF